MGVTERCGLDRVWRHTSAGRELLDPSAGSAGFYDHGENGLWDGAGWSQLQEPRRGFRASDRRAARCWIDHDTAANGRERRIAAHHKAIAARQDGRDSRRCAQTRQRLRRAVMGFAAIDRRAA